MAHLFLQFYNNNKARTDLDEIMLANGFRNIAVGSSCRSKAGIFLAKIATLAIMPLRIQRGDVLLIQYPFKKYYTTLCRVAHRRGAKVVTLVHDLGCFRRKKLTVQQEIARLDHTDVLIVHNESMAQFLSSHGYRRPMVTLGIFDYLATPLATTPTKRADEPWTVVYAGGLAKRKSTFIYLLDAVIEGWKMFVHGRGLDEEEARSWRNVESRVFIRSDDFVRESVGHFGLVWDGISIDECAGQWGEYLRVNNPHKTSFYLRAGKPVIMWNKAALTPFVLREGVGVAVSSLRDIGHKLNEISADDYAQMCRNVERVSALLADGHYFKTAFAAAMERLNDNH